MPVRNPEAPLTRLGDLPITCAQAEEMAALRCSDNESFNAELQAIVEEECGCDILPEPSSRKMSIGTILAIFFGVDFLGLIIYAGYVSYRGLNEGESGGLNEGESES